MSKYANFAISAAIIAIGVIGFQIFGQKPEVPKAELSDSDAGVPVHTAEVTPYEGAFNLEVDGEAVTYRVIAVGAEVEGRVIRKTEAARGGTFVRKGDLLFEIDPTTYRLRIDELKAQVQQADEELAAVAVSESNTTDLLDLAREEWELEKKHLQRMEELAAKGTANDVEVDAAKKNELIARNSLQTLRNQQKTQAQEKKTKEAAKALVETQLQQAEFDLQRCTVTAGLEGRIVEDEVEEGDFVKPGGILVHISDGSKMEIKCQLRGEELAWVWQQRAIRETTETNDTSQADPLNLPPVDCEVVFDFEGVETIWDGYISRLEGTGIDRETRTFPCRVLVEKPQDIRIRDNEGRATAAIPGLLSGMYVTVRIPVRSPVPMLQLPLEAARPGGQLWVCREGQLRIINVHIAHVENDMALIRQESKGLVAGDRIVVSPLAYVQDGMSIVDEGPISTASDSRSVRIESESKSSEMAE